jgi:hypothetical protein
MRINDHKVVSREERGGGERMKKVIGILCVLALLIGVAGSAMASATNWTILMRGSDTAYSNAAGLIQCGTDSLKTDARDTSDTKIVANTGIQAQVAIYQSWTDTPPLFNQDKRASIDALSTDEAKNTKVWDLRFWVGSSYTGATARLGWWTTSALNPTDFIGGKDYVYTLTMISDPTGGYAAGTTWTFNPGMTYGAANAPLGHIDFAAAGLKMADAAAVEGESAAA